MHEQLWLSNHPITYQWCILELNFCVFSPTYHSPQTDFLPWIKYLNIRIFDINNSIIQHGIGEGGGSRSYNLPALLPSSTDRRKFPAQLLDDWVDRSRQSQWPFRRYKYQLHSRTQNQNLCLLTIQPFAVCDHIRRDSRLCTAKKRWLYLNVFITLTVINPI